MTSPKVSRCWNRPFLSRRRTKARDEHNRLSNPLLPVAILYAILFVSPSAAQSADPQQLDDADRQSDPRKTLRTSDHVPDTLPTTNRALSFVTDQIATAQQKRDTFVVWMFDESASMENVRDDVADGLVETLTTSQGKTALPHSLHHVVVGFGEKTHFGNVEPTADAGQVAARVKRINRDDSGVENTFSAIREVVDRWKTPAHAAHDSILVIVTDERGNDAHKAEDVCGLCLRSGFRVFCIGPAAPFGARTGYVTMKYADGFTEAVPVDQGPESVQLQVLQIPSWGESGIERSRMSSGYGPYALSRLCKKSGGEYVIGHDDKDVVLQSKLVQKYEPDYRSPGDFEKAFRKRLSVRALLHACESSRVKAFRMPTLQFRADSRNTLRVQLTVAQKPAAVLDHRVSKVVAILKAGESDRDNLTTPRLRAAYDLAMGQALAIRARAQNCNRRMAQMKVAPRSFETEGNNTWLFKSDPDWTGVGPSVEKTAARAQEYLKRVIREHHGTPFAVLAEAELKQGLGWKWHEAKLNYPPEKENSKQLIQPLLRRKDLEGKPRPKRIRPLHVRL